MKRHYDPGIPLNPEVAHAIYDILVDECGAADGHESFGCYSLRDLFVGNQTNGFITEWRFSGALGFGGKFWRNVGRWYVSCYREDETPKRLRAIDRANKRLQKLLDMWCESMERES